MALIETVDLGRLDGIGRDPRAGVSIVIERGEVATAASGSGKSTR
jgi:hypothetical protein